MFYTRRLVKLLLLKCQPHLHVVHHFLKKGGLATESWLCSHYIYNDRNEDQDQAMAIHCTDYLHLYSWL
jgi:hypothetical protein